jgi:hypothetical protein
VVVAFTLSDDQPVEHSPAGYVSAVAAITAAQKHFGSGGVSIIARTPRAPESAVSLLPGREH